MIGSVVSHYRILEKLGEGGMGVVYKAEDTRLSRTVALKFLSPRLSPTGPEYLRFLREARAASALNHPNVLTVYSIEEADGDTFIAMEFIDGTTLGKRIPEGGLPIPEARAIALQIAEALREAHSKGIVHRDVKPDNVMITSRGQVKVMDFGLAALTGSPGLTGPTQTIGTLAYMSPEQFRGLPADQRSDIFSFGIVLYEMLAGRRPFRGEHEAALMYSVVHEEAPRLSALRGEVPADLEKLVHRTLEKDPDRRFQAMEELLTGLAAVSANATQAPGTKAVAVLPFDNISPDRENEYFSDGLTEEIIGNLSRIRTLRVVSRTSVMRFKGSGAPLADIAAALQVQYVLEGSVRKHGNDLRISAQLIDATADSHLWAEKYRGTMEDIFDIQEKVAAEIVEALKVQLTPEEHLQLRRRSTRDADAYEHYLKGRFYWNRRTDSGVRKGIGHFEEAVRIDPSFTLAHVGLADSYNILGFYSYAPPREVFARAREAAERALAIDGNLAAAHASLGYVLHYFDWKWEDAAAEFRKAMDLDPTYPIAPQFYANHLVALGKSAEALSAIERARSLDPLSMIINAAIAWVLYFARRYEEAVAQFLKTLDLDETFVVGHLYLARTYSQMGRLDDAARECERGLVLTGRMPSLLAELAHARAKAGRRDDAISLMTEIDGMRTDRYISAYQVAEIFVGLGDYPAAFEWLEKALQERCREMVLLNVEPRLDPLRSDRRFEDLVRQVGLELP